MPDRKRITITRALRNKLISERERTGLGPMRLLRGTRQEKPAGLTSKIIGNWLNGSTQVAKSEHLNFVLKRFEEFTPDNTVIKLTPEMRRKISSERARTNIGYMKLLQDNADSPTNLTSMQIMQWVNGSVARVPSHEIKFVISAYKMLPTLIEVEEGLVLFFRRERTRTGVTIPKLFRRFRDKVPENLTIKIAQKIVAGGHLRAAQNHIDFLIGAYASIPDRIRKS